MRDKNIHESEFMMTMANIWFSLSFGAASASFEVSEIDDQTHNDFFDEKFDEVRGEKEFDAESLDGISKALVGPFLNHENYSTFYSELFEKKSFYVLLALVPFSPYFLLWIIPQIFNSYMIPFMNSPIPSGSLSHS